MERYWRFFKTFEKLQKAYFALERAVNQQYNEFVQDSVIQRFEFTFELLWKTLKEALIILWITKNSPREVLIESFKQGMIDDLEFFILLKDLRNQTSHTYEEDLAKDIYNFIVKNYSKIYDVIIKLSKFKNDLLASN